MVQMQGPRVALCPTGPAEVTQEVHGSMSQGPRAACVPLKNKFIFARKLFTVLARFPLRNLFTNASENSQNQG